MLDVVLKFIGLLEYDARLLAIRENLILRTVPEGSKPQGIINFERINIVVENGVVKRAYLG